jgi:ABC-type transporter Mla subunit MlaD
MSKFTDDVAALDAAVAANTAALSKLGTLLASDTDAIKSLNDQVTQLKADLESNQTPDLTQLEADIATLQANNATAQGLVTPASPVVTGTPTTPNPFVQSGDPVPGFPSVHS